MKDPSASAGDARDMSSVPGSGRSPGGGHGNALQYYTGGCHGQRSLVVTKESMGSQRVGHD